MFGLGSSGLVVPMESADQTCPTHYFTLAQVTTVALALFPEPCEGIYSRVTMTSMTGSWYHGISYFESILLGLAILQVFVLRYFRILPINLSNLFTSGLEYGRKKRDTHLINHKERQMSEALFTALRRIDEGDCLLRSICELQSSRIAHKLPNGLVMTFNTLRRSAQRRRKNLVNFKSNNETVEERSVMSIFEEAVEIGDAGCSANTTNEIIQTSNATLQSSCQTRYSLCSLSTEDIIHYVETIQLNDF